LSYYRLLLIALIFVLGQQLETNLHIAKYFVYGPLVAYAVLYIWKGVFVYNKTERILFGLGEAIGIAIFSLYVFGLNYIAQYDLDFIGLGAILILDIFYYTVRLISWLVYGKVSP
jgi:hypothetical protein